MFVEKICIHLAEHKYKFGCYNAVKSNEIEVLSLYHFYLPYRNSDFAGFKDKTSGACGQFTHFGSIKTSISS